MELSTLGASLNDFIQQKEKKRNLSAQFIGISYLFKLDWTAHNIGFRIIINEVNLDSWKYL